MPIAASAEEAEGRDRAAGEPPESVLSGRAAGGAMGGHRPALPFVEEIGGGDGGERAAAGGVLPDSAAAPPSALPFVLDSFVINFCLQL